MSRPKLPLVISDVIGGVLKFLEKVKRSSIVLSGSLKTCLDGIDV